MSLLQRARNSSHLGVAIRGL